MKLITDQNHVLQGYVHDSIWIPAHICEIRLSTHILQHHHLEEKDGKCQIFLTLVQKIILQIVHLSFS